MAYQKKAHPMSPVERASLGGKASAAKLSPEAKRRRARKAVRARWARYNAAKSAA
jgi:hypothetical protein